MIIEGTFALQISKETVPDFDTAKIELSSTSDFISLSTTISQLSKYGPGIYDIIVSLGKDEVLKRLGNKIFI